MRMNRLAPLSILAQTQNPQTHTTRPDPYPRQLRSSPSDYLPFLDGVSEGPEFEQYCRSVEESAEWGGQVELQVNGADADTAMHGEHWVLRKNRGRVPVVGEGPLFAPQQ